MSLRLGANRRVTQPCDLLQRAGLIAAVLVAGWLVVIPAVLKAAPAASPEAKSIFDDDFHGVDNQPTPGKAAPPAPAPGSNPTPPTSDTPLPPAVVPPVVQSAPGGAPEVSAGLVAELFDAAGTLKEARIVKRVRVTLNSPKPGIMPMIMRWHGLIVIPAGGMTVSFRFQALGKAEVMVDGKMTASERTGDILQLTEGQHKLSVAVKDVMVQAARETIYLGWTPSGEEFQPVPSTVFFHSREEEPGGMKAAGPAPNVTLTGKPGQPPSPGLPSSPGLPLTPSPAEAATPAGTLPVPSDGELANLRKAIKARYSADYASTSHIVREALVNKLVGAAGESTASASSQYALLKEAIDLSLALGDIKTALACTDQICAAYKVDVPEVKLGTLTAASHVPRSLGTGHAVGDAAMALSTEAGDNIQFDTAARAAQLAETAYGPTGEDAARAKARVRDIREMQSQYAKIAPLLKKIKETPDDPDANTKAGRYFCLTLGNLEKGLPLLVKGDDAALKVLAEMELSPPTDADNQIKLGDGWWDKAHAETAIASTFCKNRAAFWYDNARGATKDVPSRIMDRLATLSRTIDLIPLLDLTPAPEANAGQAGVAAQRFGAPAWKRDHDRLVYANGFDSVLQLPYRPAGDYDFIVDFTTSRGNGGIVQMMPVRGEQLEWSTFATTSNFQPLSLRRGSFGPMLKGAVPIVAGQRYVSTVEFRKTGVRGYLNGTLIRAWDTDYSELGNGYLKLPDPQCLGLRCNGADIVVNSIRVVEHGHGQR